MKATNINTLDYFLNRTGTVDLQLPVLSVPINTKVVSSNPVHGEEYSIQHYVKMFVSDFRQIDGVLNVLRFPPPIKLTANGFFCFFFTKTGILRMV